MTAHHTHIIALADKVITAAQAENMDDVVEKSEAIRAAFEADIKQHTGTPAERLASTHAIDSALTEFEESLFGVVDGASDEHIALIDEFLREAHGTVYKT